MPISKYRKIINEELAKKALDLYKTGVSLRDMEPIIGYSYEWIRQMIMVAEEKEKVDNSLLTDVDKETKINI